MKMRKKILKKLLNNGFFLYFNVQKTNKIFPGKYFRTNYKHI